jgi:carbon-monoxide dehydrogenase medium subunit
VRNRGTIGGSLAHADPAADLPTLMLLLGATLTASDGKAARQIPAASFFVDLFTTALKPGELLTKITVPGYGKGTGAVYLKHRHPASAYAVVGVGALVETRDGRCARAGLVVGGAGATPVRVAAAEQALTGKAADASAIAAAADALKGAIKDPLSDPYASGEFRVHLATVMARRALALAAERSRA